MVKRFLPLTLGLALAWTSHGATADTFDDAVNLYLKGFDHCTEAKDALSAGNLGRASAALKQYEALKQEAVGINDSILSTNKRGMDSNLKFCERVATDIEIEAGTPMLEQAIAACDEANTALKAGQPDQAKAAYERFTTYKNQALDTAPKLNDLFSTRNQIRRCERLEKKIAGFSQKQEALSLAIETALEESAAYRSQCQQALNALGSADLSDAGLNPIRSGLTEARARKQAVMTESLALAELEKTPDSPEKKQLDDNLSQGDRCSATLASQLQAKEATLAAAQGELKEYQTALTKAETQCKAVQKSSANGVTEARYQQAKTQYESAVSTRNQVKAALAKSRYYQANAQEPSAKRIASQLGNLNQCLDASRNQLSALFSALPMTVPPIPSQASNTQAQSGAGTPAIKITGSIKMLNTTPEFALIYMVDGGRPSEGVEIIIDASGFDQSIYVAGSGDTFRIKSKDYSTHRIIASIDELNFSDTLARVQSRQTRTAKVSWPSNHLAQVRSDRGNVVPTYIANVPSGNYKVVMFDFGTDTLSFELNNPSEAAEGYLLLPGYDPRPLKISQGEIKSLAITRDKEPLGSVLLKGL